MQLSRISKKMWQLDKSHVVREKTEAEGRKTRLNIWLVSVITVMFLLFECVQTWMWEHGFVFAVVSSVILFAANHSIRSKLRKCLVGAKAKIQRR